MSVGIKLIRGDLLDNVQRQKKFLKVYRPYKLKHKMVHLGGGLGGTNFVPKGLSFSIFMQKGDFAATCFQLEY